MRIDTQTATIRKWKAAAMFQNGRTARQVNEALFHEYGYRMNLNKLYALRKAVLKKGKRPAKTQTQKQPPQKTPQKESDEWSL